MNGVTFNDISKLIGGTLACAIGTVDLWRFHSLGNTADTTFIVGGLAVFGIGIAVPSAFRAGVGAGAMATKMSLMPPPTMTVASSSLYGLVPPPEGSYASSGVVPGSKPPRTPKAQTADNPTAAE